MPDPSALFEVCHIASLHNLFPDKSGHFVSSLSTTVIKSLPPTNSEIPASIAVAVFCIGEIHTLLRNPKKHSERPNIADFEIEKALRGFDETRKRIFVIW
jgi:hypothetical protein